MAGFDSNLLKRLHHLWLVWRQTGARWIAPPRSRLLASARELTGHRDYCPGDDYRQVDWGLCARHDELRTRQFQGDVDSHLYLFLDCSQSMTLGRPTRFDAARKAAAAIGYCALASLCRVAVVAYADRIVADLPPLCGKPRAARLLGFLEAIAPARAPTNLATAAAAFVRRCQRHGPAIVLSDLHDPAGLRQGLQILRRRGYAPRVLWIWDQCEAEPDVLGDLESFDVETGLARQVTVTEADLRRYRQRYADFARSMQDFCASQAIPCVRIPTDVPEEDFLLRAVGAKP